MPDCMTCADATVEDMLTEQLMHGAIPLCRFHAAALEEIAVARGLSVGPKSPDKEA